MTIDPQDIISWSVTKSLMNKSNATIRLDNSEGTYSFATADYRGQVLSIVAVQDSVEYPLYVGRVTSVVPSYGIDGTKYVTFTLISVSDILAKRPVATETLENMTGAEVMEYLLTVYGGLDPAFFDVSEDNGEVFSNITIMENSVEEAVKKIAQACNVDLFVGASGKLTTALKKDETDTATVSLTASEDIGEGTLDETTSEMTMSTVAKVRGRYENIAEDEGLVVIDDQVISFTVYGAVTVYETKLPIPPGRILTDAEAYNTIFTLNPAYDTPVTAITADGIFTDTDGNQYWFVTIYGDFTAAGHEYSMQLTATVAPNVVKKSLSFENINVLRPVKNYHKIVMGPNLTAKYMGLVTTPDFAQVSQNTNETKEFRIEATSKDAAMVAVYGVRYMEIDNDYIQDAATAEAIGDRALKEAKWSGHLVSCSGPFKPTLREPGTVVNVPLMYEGVTYKCLLNEITVNYNAEDASLLSSYNFVRLFA